MERQSKLRNNSTNRGTTNGSQANAPSSTLGQTMPQGQDLESLMGSEGLRGKGLNQTLPQINIGNQGNMTSGQASATLPKLTSPKTIVPQNFQLNPKLRSNHQDSMTLEVRSKEAQMAMMNQSATSSFKYGNSSATPKQNQITVLPNLVQNSSPKRKNDSTIDYLGGSLGKVDNFGITRQSFVAGSSTQRQNKGHSVDISHSSNRAVQFREEISNDQYQALVNVMNSAKNTHAIQPIATTVQNSVFTNYMMKVVQSVERRKKKASQNILQVMNNQTQKLQSLVGEDLDYTTTGVGLSKKISQPNQLALQNFSNQIIPERSSNTSADYQKKIGSSKFGMLELYDEKRDLANGSIVSQKESLAITSEKRSSSMHQSMSEAGASALKSHANNQVAVVGFNSVFAEPKATEQVAFLLKEAQKKDKIFIPLERAPDIDSGLMYKEMKNAPDNHGGIVVFSKQGFVTVGKAKNATSEFVSNENFIQDGVNKYILRDLPFFKKFHAMKVFKQWKYIMKWNAYSRKRVQLANNLHIAKPMFAERYPDMIPLLNNIRTLPFVDIKQNITYGKKQQQLLEDKCNDMLKDSKIELNKTLKSAKDKLDELKQEIETDDKRYENAVKERRMMEIIKNSKNGKEDLIMFSKARRQKEQEEEQFSIQKQRHHLFDKFVLFVLKIVCANLIEAIYENKRIFKEIFRDQKLGPQFEVSVCFNENGVMDTDPSMTAHHQSFENVFNNIEVTIYQNQTLIDFINDLVSLLFTEKQLYYKSIFENMRKVLNENVKHKENHHQIFETLDKDIQKCKDYLEQFISLQEIYDFANDWELNQRDKQISLEMSFYKETWMEMEKYSQMVEKIPTSNTKMGTILVETLSLKKYLAELPKKVIDSIRSNVTNTMETETKSLREELSKTSEILDQLPGSLNVYVEQVNTLKYVKEKQEEFSNKFSTINKLHQLCKMDNIKVSLNLQQAIDEVSHLYETLPKLQRRAQDGLNSNKDTMEKIMHSSSLVLSKKIKAFEKKYVETYLQDRSRIEDCADTLEELFKRSKAIHEIRSKVILYKEFLKLLYEDDPYKEEKMKQNKLQCSEDYEFVAELHKQTIKLWKMLLYWRKRRHMCYNTPFLTLDMNKIIRSINKINRYFEEKLSKNDFLKEKSRPLYKVVMLQVKETSLIIEFLKDLRRESLQQRHWLQIFHLIKAPHLKNSTTFTIVNLREYHIQNYREEIVKIIEHANTELKYERVFRAIKDEWDKHELKIIPYKETMDSYILVSTENLSSAIEENLTTLENISQSKYAIHIKSDIEEWISTLKLMLKNLEIWVNAQHHWINLDPILQSSTQLAEVLKNDANGIGYGNNEDIDAETSEFLNLRSQFKRIMWSSFKKPKATYNLMIKTRIEVFQKLIKHFSVLQKKVHDFLEQRRRAFPRFFFLTDNQFLEFLTLANSNQDFNEYINVMFQGAHKLFINRILGKEPLKDTVQLENNIQTAIKEFEQIKDEQAANLEATEKLGSSPMKGGRKSAVNGSMVSHKGGVSVDESDELRTEFSGSMLSSAKKGGADRSSFKSLGMLSNTQISKEDKERNAVEEGKSEVKTTPEEGKQAKENKNEQQSVSESFEVLGMISMNKELFLFEKPIPMVNGVENWLTQVEKAMHETISKMLSYAVSSFPNQPLDEWILDYPQQVILTVLHLILSHEITEVFESQKRNLQNSGELGSVMGNDSQPTLNSAKDVKDKQSDNGGAPKSSRRDNEGGAAGQSSKSVSKQQSPKSEQSAGKTSKLSDEDDDPGMAEYIRRKNELKAQQQAEEEEARKKMADENRRKFEANELPKDPEKEKRRFIDEMFGFDFPISSRLLLEELNLNSPKDGEVSQSDVDKAKLTNSQQQKALKLMASKKTDFKEIVMDNLNKKSLQGINLRIHFWLNSVIKSLYRQLGGIGEKILLPEITLHSIQKMIMKSIASFLIYQRDIVDNLMNKNITEVEDFEWQSQIRLFWTGIEPSCKVLCGGWSENQQNEYLGSHPRLVMTPLTNRYFVFIASALREKSSVLFNSSETSNSIAGDVFEEFSNMCMAPFKKVVCTPVLDLKPLMQSLNGAALASFWVFFKNIDQLQFSYIQTFNKEVQMLQQQFIIQDLIGGAEIPDTHNLINTDMLFSSNNSNTKISGNLEGLARSSQSLQNAKTAQFASQKSSNGVKEKQKLPVSQKRMNSLGIFATISPFASLKRGQNDSLLAQLSGSFRVLSFCRFNERIMFLTILKAEGFFNYQLLARLSNEYLTSLYDLVYGPPANHDEAPKKVSDSVLSILSKRHNDQLTPEEESQRHVLSLRDLRLVVKLANLIREQEQRMYLTTKHEEIEQEEKTSQKAMHARVKKRDERMMEHQWTEIENEIVVTENRCVEVKSLQEGLRLVCRQKLFALEWKKSEENNAPKKDDQYSKIESVEKMIAQCMENNFDKQKRDDTDELIELAKKMEELYSKQKDKADKDAQLENHSYTVSHREQRKTPSQKFLERKSVVMKKFKESQVGLPLNKQSTIITGGGLIRRKSISSEDVNSRYSLSVGLSELKHNAQKVSDNKAFIDEITKILKELIVRLNFSKSNAQLRNCVNVLDLLRRQKAIAFVGPVCSGKTTVLKIVSNILHVAFKIKLRTSVVNTATMTSKELYGSIDAFNKYPKTNIATQNNQTSNDDDFSKSGIFKIILDVFEKERQQANIKPSDQEKPKIIQSIFFDSCDIDQPLSESLIDFIERTNKREELRNSTTEYLFDFKVADEIRVPALVGDDRVPVTLPNGNVIQFPSDLFLFFETTSLRNASPPFIAKVGLVVTEQDDLNWQQIFNRQLILFLKKQEQFFKDIKFEIAQQNISECAQQFILPFLEKLTTHSRIISWEYFNSKAATLQFFNLLNCVMFKLRDVIKQRKIEEDQEYEYLLKECERDVIWSNALLCCIWSFGALLPKEHRRPFEEVFQPYKRMFNMSMSQSAAAQTAGPRNRFTLFDIYYDPETLQWELLQENIDYKLKLQYDPLSNQLLIPTVEVSQCFFMMDILIGSGPRYDENALDNKHFRAIGPGGVGKSFAVNSFLKKVNGESRFQIVQIPMSAFTTIERIKENVEQLYHNKRRNLLDPKDKERNIVLLIEDVHLQSNLNVNILEFLRTWCMSKGYYDIQQGFFKGVGNFVTVTTENTDYRRNEATQFKGRSPQSHRSRFLYYTNTIYLDEYDSQGIERFKMFTQQWFTSKLWSTSKLLNKYYILVQNTLLSFIEKMKRIDAMHNSTFHRLTSFHFFQNFCQNLVVYTSSKEDIEETHSQGLKEEDIVSNMMIYEIMRMYGDRLHRATQKNLVIQKLIECCKQEFVGRSSLQPQGIEQILVGNYHERRPGALVKYSNINLNMHADIKEQIKKKLRSSSNNFQLESILESPNSIKEIFKFSRILYKDMQNLIAIGPSGGGKYEILQLAAILNEALVFELNCSRLCEAFQFVKAFKKAVIAAVGTNKPSYLVISEAQLRDPIYIDFVNNFIQNMSNKFETTVLWGDLEFKRILIENERTIYTNSVIKRAAEPTEDQLLVQAMRKLQKNVHIVFMIDDFQTYFEWVSLFPHLEILCEVHHFDELNTEGYKRFTQQFISQRASENNVFQDQKLQSALVELRQIVKNQIVNNFYSPLMLKYTCSEEFMHTGLTEFLFNCEEKMNNYLFTDGNFRIRDPYHRQYNYNLPVKIQSLYRSRYTQFLELFRYLYDFIALGLMVRRNYYEAFLRKAAEFTDFFKDIKQSKTKLHSESYQLTFKVAAMRDKVTKLRTLIDDRQKHVIQKQNELREAELELQVNQEEVDQAMEERDQALDDIINHFEKVTGSEFIYILSQFSRFSDAEQQLLDLFAILVEKNARIEGYSKKDHSGYFQDREDLINLLDERRNFDFDEQCLFKFKDYMQLYTAADFKDKPLFKLMFQYFHALYKKLNLRNVMANTYSRVKQFKAQIEQIQFTLNYSRNYIAEKKQDLEEVEQRYKDLEQQSKQLSLKIEEAEISHMRTEHIIEQIEKYASKMMIKMGKIKKRIETLLGDSLILACSVVFLGAFSLKERKQIRKEMAEYLNTTTAGYIKCGSYWTEKNGINNSKLLRSVLKEYGIGGNSAEDLILSTIPQGIISQENLVESIFTLIFSPSCPYVVDPTGQLQNFIQNSLLGELQIKPLYASDQGIGEQIESVFRSKQFAILNDLNDCSQVNFGLCQDEPLLQRLTNVTFNGFEHDPNLLKNNFIKDLLKSKVVNTTHTSVNKRLNFSGVETSQNQGNIPGGQSIEQQQASITESFSFYQLQVFSPRFDFTLNSEYMARATMLVTIDEDEVTNLNPLGNNSAWIDIKELMLKHFAPEECTKLKDIKEKIRRLERHKNQVHKNFENAFLVANQETLQRLSEYSVLKQSVEEIKYFDDEKKGLQETFTQVLSSHPLLSSYANVITIMFQTLKKLSKICGIVTYSWRTFIFLIEQVFSKTVKDLTSIIQAQNLANNQQSSTSIIVDSQGRLAIQSTKNQQNKQLTQIEFTLDEEFFSTKVIPSIYGVITSSFKPQLAPLYNLIFAVKLAFKKKEITESEVEYFFKQLFLLKNFENWRHIESNLVDMEDRVDKTKFLMFKREIIKIYPEHGRKIIDIIEKDITQSFQYKQASHTLNFKVFSKGSEYAKLKLFQKINIGFISPDHEFKTKLIQLVYEQLSSVFSFSEVPMKLHDFVRMASWSEPISLIPQQNINTINSICSIASYYGVSLQVVRSSELSKAQQDQNEQHSENVELKFQIQQQLQDYTHGADNQLFTHDAFTYQRDAHSKIEFDDQVSQSAFLPKVYIESLKRKELMRQDEKSIMGQYQGVDPLELIEQSATSGNWVFISTLRFPTYWQKMVSLLRNLHAQNKIKSSFRIFVDLQGFSQNEIPDSFLFDNSISFFMTEKNNSEVLDQHQDIWSSLLNPKVLSELTDYKHLFADDVKKMISQAVVEEMQNALVKSSMQGGLGALSVMSKSIGGVSNVQPNFIGQQQHNIKDEKQRDLYSQFMMHSQPIAEQQAKQLSEEIKDQDQYLAQMAHLIDSSQSHNVSLGAALAMQRANVGASLPLNASFMTQQSQEHQQKVDQGETPNKMREPSEVGGSPEVQEHSQDQNQRQVKVLNSTLNPVKEDEQEDANIQDTNEEPEQELKEEDDEARSKE